MKYLSRFKSSAEIPAPALLQESAEPEPQKSHDEAMIDPGATGGTLIAKEKAGKESSAKDGESEKALSKNLSICSNIEEHNSDVE